MGLALQKTPVLSLLAVTVLPVAPFLFKAVHVDDPYYLAVAENVRANPRHPYSGVAPWGYGDWFAVNSNPPLWSYVLAAAIAAFGNEDWKLQLVAAVPYSGLVFGLFCLCRRLTTRPLPWTMFLAWSTFLLPGRNLMVDVPMLALWVWAVEFHLRSLSRQSHGGSWLGGSLAACGILTKYTAMLLPAVVVFTHPCASWRKLFRFVVPIAAVVIAWCGFVLLVYHRLPFGSHALGGHADWLDRVRILVRQSGGVFWLTPIWTLAAVAGSRHAMYVVAVIGTLAVFLGYADATTTAAQMRQTGIHVPIVQTLHFAAFTANGTAVMALAPLLLQKSWQIARGNNPATQLMIVWAAAALFFNLVMIPSVPFGAVRHLAVFLTPAVLASLPALEILQFGKRPARLCFRATIVFNVVLGLALALSDAQLSAVYRRAAREHIAPRSAQATVWFVGDSSFRYYAESAGAHYWDAGDQDAATPATGDWFITSYLYQVKHVGWRQPEFWDRLRIHSVDSTAAWVPLRTVSQLANFYGGSVTTVPWELALIPVMRSGEPFHVTTPALEAIFVYRVH